MKDCKNAALDTCPVDSESCKWASQHCSQCDQHYKVSRVAETAAFMLKDHKKICLGRKK